MGFVFPITCKTLEYKCSPSNQPSPIIISEEEPILRPEYQCEFSTTVNGCHPDGTPLSSQELSAICDERLDGREDDIDDDRRPNCMARCMQSERTAEECSHNMPDPNL